MAERVLGPVVVMMLLVAGIYGFDVYNQNGGITGFVVNTEQAPPCSETDSNDDPSTRGTVSSPIYEGGQETDRCVGDDLLEFYCGENGPEVRGVTCQFGCFEGACN